MDPAHIVETVVEGVALQSDHGASLADVWDFASSAVGNELDAVLKNAVWGWLQHNPALIATDSGTVLGQRELEESLPTLMERHDVRIYASENEQWLALTGRPRQGNPIGPSPFQVLCAVARARARGLTAVEINQETGQDARSIHGRVAQLADMGLVVRYPVVKHGSHTHLVVFHKFVDANKQNEEATAGPDSLNKQELTQKLLMLAKSGPNQLRLVQELYRESGFDSLRRGPQLFRAMVRRLEAQGILKKVDVYDPQHPEHHYRCVQYLKDPSEELINEPDQNGELDENDDETFGDFVNAPQHIPEGGGLENMVVASSSETLPLANLYYPLEHQIYDLVARAGIAGVPAMELSQTLTGLPYAKTLNKLLDQLVMSDSKSGGVICPASLRYLLLERGIDFAARMKFYRYFTQIAYAHYQKEPCDPRWGTFSDATSATDTCLADVDTKWAKPCPGTASIIETSDGTVKALFHGDKPDYTYKTLRTSEATGKKRGRPRKTAPEAPVTPITRKARPAFTKIKDRIWHGGLPVPDTNRGTPALIFDESEAAPEIKVEPVTAAATAPTIDPPHVGEPGLQIDRPIQADEKPLMAKTESKFSIANLKRQELILAAVAAAGGVAEGGQALARRIDAMANGDTSIDRKTLSRAVEKLVATGKLGQIFVSTASSKGINITRYLVHDPAIAADDERIVDAKKSISESVRSRPAAPGTVPLRATNQIDSSALDAILQNTEHPRRYRVLGEKEKKAKTKTRFGPNASEVSAEADVTQSGKKGRPRKSEEEKRAAALAKAEAKREREVKRELKRKVREHEEVEDRLGPIDTTLLYRAIIITRSLHGKGPGIDWDAVVEAVPNLSPSRARKRWPAIREDYGGTKGLALATEQWENLFLKGYAEGSIDYKVPGDDGFSLESYLSFWNENSDSMASRGDILESRAEFESRNGKIKEHPLVNPLEAAFNLPSMVRVDELMANTPFGFSVTSPPVLAPVFDDAELTVRSIIAADDDKYSQDEGQLILESVGEATAKAAIDDLCQRKMALYIPRDTTKVIPGRNFGFTERVLNSLTTKFTAEDLAEAAAFETMLGSTRKYNLPFDVQDPAMIPLLQLVALGKVRLERANQEMGRLITDYRSRLISKDKLDFDIVLKIKPFKVPKIPAVEYPLDEPERPFVWQLKDRVSGQSIYERLAHKILMTVVSRPHVTEPLLEVELRAGFASKEVRAIVAWLKESRLIAENNGLVPDMYWFRPYRV